LAELDQAEERIKELQSQLKTKPEKVSEVAERALKEANQKIRDQAEIIQE